MAYGLIDGLVRAALSPASGILYAEDFDDDPAPPPGPAAPPEPLFTATELEAARAGAADEARHGAMRSAEVLALDRRGAALSGIAEGLQKLGGEVGEEVSRQTEELSRAVMSMMVAALPSLMAGTARREVSDLLGRLLPGLHAEKQVAVRINPHLMEAIGTDLAGLDEACRQRIVLVPTDALAPGDLRVSWHEGRLVRDTAAIHRAAQDILHAAGWMEAAHG